MNFASAEPQFVGVVVAGLQDAAKNVSQFGLVVDEAKQGFAARALDADAKDILRGGIEVDDKKVIVNENDTRAQAVKNTLGVWVARAVVARLPACFPA
jgi:hypothetical protein